MKVACAAIIVNAISRFSFHLTFSMSFEKASHMNEPNIIHHISIQRNESIQVMTEEVSTVQLFTTSSITKKSASAVQSLKRLSHSNIRTNLLGAQNCLNKDKTATGSVEDIIVQNSKVTSIGTLIHTNASANLSANQIKNVEISNHNTARSQIDFQFFKRLLYHILYPDSNIRTGRNTKNSISGVSLNPAMKCKKGSFVSGTRTNHATTSNTVYGIFTLFESIYIKLDSERSESIARSENRNDESIRP